MSSNMPPIIPGSDPASRADQVRHRASQQLILDLSHTGNYTPEYNDTLLTPPSITRSRESPPFKPSDSDNTSLNMKSRHRTQHRGRRELNRAYVSGDDMYQAVSLSYGRALSHNCPSRSKSAPDLRALCGKTYQKKDRKYNSLDKSIDQISQQVGRTLAQRRDSLPKQPRRWTVPSKAPPTRCMSGTISIGEFAPLIDKLTEHFSQSKSQSSGPGSSVPLSTPAMITLHRATIGKSHDPPIQRETYTSFPQPVFNKASPSLIESFLSFVAEDPDVVRRSSVAANKDDDTSTGSRKASIERNKVIPSLSTVTTPVFTEVTMESIVVSDDLSNDVERATRRCSTKYTAGSNVLQVIWDENANSTNSTATTTAQNSRRPTRRELGGKSWAVGRNGSMAMDMLETQMFKAIQQSRKASVESQFAEEETMVTGRPGNSHQKSLRNMHNYGFAEQSSEPFPGILSLPRAASTSNETVNMPISTLIQNMSPAEKVDFFPPLPSRVMTKTEKKPLDLDLLTSESEAWASNAFPTLRQRTTSLELQSTSREGSSASRIVPEKTRYGSLDVCSRTGSMIGSSTQRRKTSVQKGRSGRPRGVVVASFVDDGERFPLLRHPAFNEMDPFGSG